MYRGKPSGKKQESTYNMHLTSIKTETDYQQALKRLEVIFDAPLGTSESNEADMLGQLIYDYEQINYPINEPDPIEAAKIRKEV
jgi:HTH-type transcriptional regulator/antitoxin HigA